MSKESGIDTSVAGPSHAATTSSDTETDSSSAGSFIYPAAKKARKQAFRKAWLEDPKFQSWLEETKDPYKAKCTACSKLLTPSKHKLQNHASTILHKTNMHQKACNRIDIDLAAKKEKKVKKQTFCKSWMEDPQFQSWLEETEDPYKAKCTACSKLLTPSKHKLQNHASTILHSTNMHQKPCNRIDIDLAAKKEKKVKRQTFCKSWIEDPQFQSWVQEAADPYKARCAACCTNVWAGKSELQKHARSLKHNTNMKHRKEPLHKNRSFTDSVKVLELKICLEIIEHNRSFSSYNHFTKMIQSGMPNADVAQHVSLHPTKISAIVKNVINKAVILETTEILKGKFFSILVDETTDISDTKMVCFLIRYVHGEKIQTYLLDLIGINEYTAENLHKCLLNSLKKYNVPVSNIVGVCADNTDVMLGRQNSLISRLLADNKEISVFPCICHSMNVVASQACKHLPSHIEEVLDSVYTCFSRSPKLQKASEGMQDFINFGNQRLLQLSRNKWLALTECVERILNKWQDLFAIFEEAASGGCEVVAQILDTLQCPYTKAYLQFLNHILQTFTTINKYFQDSKVLVHCLLPECYKLLRVLGGDFIKSQYITGPNIHRIDVYNEANLMPLQTIFHGVDSMRSIEEIRNSKGDVDNQKLLEFHTNIQKCYQSAFQNIVQRVPFDEPFLNSLEFLNPHTAVDINKHDIHQLDSVLNKFTSKFDSGRIKDEWHKIPFYFSNEERQKLSAQSIPCFWNEIRNTKNEVGEYIFPNISKLADLCLSLPHSNADVERYFSTITDIKTKRRNRLTPQTIAALTRVQLDLKNKNANCFNYEITDSMTNLFNDDMYKVESIPKELTGILLPVDTDESSDTENI